MRAGGAEKVSFELTCQEFMTLSSLNSIQWLRKLDEPQKHDLGLSRIEVNGEWFEKLEMRNDENTHYPAIHTFQKRKCELISKVLITFVLIIITSNILKLHFSHATSIETGQYLCYGEPEIHQSYNVQLIENEREQSFVLEMLLSSMLLLVLLLALIITLVQHYHPRSSQNEQNSFLPSSPFPNEL